MPFGPIATPPHESYTCGNAGGRAPRGPPARLVGCENALAAQGVSLRLKFNKLSARRQGVSRVGVP